MTARTAADPRIADLERRMSEADGARRAAALATELAELRQVVRSEKLGEVAAEFDGSTASSGRSRWDRSTR